MAKNTNIIVVTTNTQGISEVRLNGTVIAEHTRRGDAIATAIQRATANRSVIRFQ